MGRLHKIVCVALVALATTATPGMTQDASDTPKRMQAIRVNPHRPVVDGDLSDDVWQHAVFANGFLQKEPTQGAPPENRSEIAVVYDDDAIYIGARLHSANPDNILATVSRRDNAGNSERIIVSFDTYHDKRTAYSFAVTASGTRIDYYHSSDNEFDRDYEFDPVWTAKTARTGDGWTAEMRIPFSQLRFRRGDPQVWGVNVNRWVPTTNEDSYWIVVPREAQGWSSRMGELVGIEGVRPSRRIEVTPYAASDVTRTSNPDPEDPFTEETNYDARAGADFKMGVGPNLTLEGTINPDFGQVEADPAEVNLSAFETFFDERRPFFTEGANLLRGGGPNYFYSRRIGAAPHGDADGDYTKIPPNTSILGAAKMTGRLNSGLSVGVLGAVTQEEKADVFDATSNQTSRVPVEPLSGFGVVSMQQEFGANQSTVGLNLTGMGRDPDAGNNLNEILNDRAFTGGTSWNLRFNGGDYEYRGNVGYSHIEGTRQAIEGQQRSSRRYFQRPDKDYATLDTTRTALTGWTAATSLEKIAGRWLLGGGISAESPEFELNDAGRLGTTDDIDGWVGGRHRQTTPGSWYQSWWVGYWMGSGYNFGGDRQYAFLDYETSLTFRNFYSLWWGVEFFPKSNSDNLTRGGPLMETAEDWNFAINLSSHNKGRMSWWLWGRYARDDVSGLGEWAEGGITYRPGSRWELSVTPRYGHVFNTRQYFDTAEGNGPTETFDNRYIFATLDRHDLVMQTRLNYAFTPDLTLEFYAEPFAASGSYSNIGHLKAPRTKNLLVYGTEGTTITRDENGDYTVTDGTDTFNLDNGDFNFVSFRSNFVLRWEWSPGSTLFFVWQQNRSDSNSLGDPIGASSLWDSLSADGDNFIAVKISYWIPFL